MISESNYENVVNLINSKIDAINSKYPNLVSEELRKKAITIYANSGKEIDIIDKELTSELKKMENIHNISLNSSELDTGLKTNHQGIYLSSLMITALSLINCSNISEINEWIDSVPNLYMISQLPNNNYSTEQIDSVKRKLFEIYQDSMISTQVVNDINSGNKEEAMRYALHKKLSGLNLSIENELDIGDIGFSKGLASMYKEIERVSIDKFGREKGKRISSKIVYYFTTDYENFSSSTYEQMVVLNEQIKKNIKKCNSLGGDFQLVLRSVGYGNTVFEKLNDNNAVEYFYNYDISVMGQNLSEKLGASYRLRSMINRNAAEEMSKKGLASKDKETVIKILRESLKYSLISFNSNIKNDGKNRTFELFNELVEIKEKDEIKKKDNDFKLVWEEKFGITLEDIVNQVVKPNMQLIQDLKTKNVDFMYNETLLQESSKKTKKVMETMLELQRLAPGLITVFGDQDHTFSSDYTEEKIEQLRATADFDKQISQIVIGKTMDGKDIKLKLECSERDLYLSKTEVLNMKQLGMSNDDILKYKQALQNKHNKIFNNVPFERECEWTAIDNISGDYSEDKGTYVLGKYPEISKMAKKDNLKKIDKDITDFNNWRSKVKKERNICQENVTQSKVVRAPEVKSSRLSTNEIQIAQLVKLKNMIINQRKEQKSNSEKPKVKTLTKDSNCDNTSSSKGFINISTITLITIILVSLIYIIIYNILK